VPAYIHACYLNILKCLNFRFVSRDYYVTTIMQTFYYPINNLVVKSLLYYLIRIGCLAY
jgi:hypothetical protein